MDPITLAIGLGLIVLAWARDVKAAQNAPPSTGDGHDMTPSEGIRPAPNADDVSASHVTTSHMAVSEDAMRSFGDTVVAKSYGSTTLVQSNGTVASRASNTAPTAGTARRAPVVRRGGTVDTKATNAPPVGNNNKYGAPPRQLTK